MAGVTDSPAYRTSVQIGAQRKFVFDYVGVAVEELIQQRHMPGPIFEGNGAAMPRSVTEIEDAIEAFLVRRAARKATTVQVLRSENYEFRSAAAAETLQLLIRNCRVDLARQFIAAGASAANADTEALARCGNRPQ